MWHTHTHADTLFVCIWHILTHISIASYWWELGKQRRPRSDATERGIWSGSQRFANRVSKGAKIRNRYNQVPHLTQDTNGVVTNSQLDTTNESQEVSPFPAGDPKAQINKGVTNTRQKNINDPQKKYQIGTVSIFFPCYSYTVWCTLRINILSNK